MDITLSYMEVQKPKPTWVWLILILAGIFAIGNLVHGFYQQIIEGIAWGNNPVSNTELIIISVIVVILFLGTYFLIGFSKLIVKIDSESIQYKFFPFHWRFHLVSWENVDKFKVVTFNPYKEFGGWGIRFRKNIKAFIVAGDKGLLLYMKSGKKILFGTQNAAELAEFVKNKINQALISDHKKKEI